MTNNPFLFNHAMNQDNHAKKHGYHAVIMPWQPCFSNACIQALQFLLVSIYLIFNSTIQCYRWVLNIKNLFHYRHLFLDLNLVFLKTYVKGSIMKNSFLISVIFFASLTFGSIHYCTISLHPIFRMKAYKWNQNYDDKKLFNSFYSWTTSQTPKMADQ